MNRKTSLWLALVLFAVPAFFEPSRAIAAEAAASIAVGGIVPRGGTRVAIAREVLRIGVRNVSVDYDFRNDSSADVTMDLVFPIPPYKNEWDAMDPAAQSFRSFVLSVNDEKAAYQTEVAAELNGGDITKTLQSHHIDIPTFGHLEIGRDQHFRVRRVAVPDFIRLSKKDQDRLESEGIFEREDGYSKYTVKLEYHWTQTFPAHSMVHIRQEFAPVVGFAEVPALEDALQAALKPASTHASTMLEPAATGSVDLLNGFCANTSFLRSMLRAQQMLANSSEAVLPQWVDFALMSTKEWNEPIEDFTLIVEVPQPQRGQQTLVSFCSPGNIQKPDADHIQVHLTNFTPSMDLHVGFFNEPMNMPSELTAMR
jgi:Domain of unknown function (DUF4424)